MSKEFEAARRIEDARKGMDLGAARQRSRRQAVMARRCPAPVMLLLSGAL